MINLSIDNILKIKDTQFFNILALETFNFQFQHNSVYQQWCNLIGVKPEMVKHINEIPFLPISFFKSHKIVTTNFEPQIIFESSKTTGQVSSKHFVKSIAVYEKCFSCCFELFYNNIEDYCILGLLPSYLERNNSSLVYMVQNLITKSKHEQSGFYLTNFKQLYNTLQSLEANKQPTILFGVTFALLDFAQQFPMVLKNTIIIETGGMKGRKEELTRAEVHHILCNAFNTKQIHSEYGMTELLSQAYSKHNGKFFCPPWMKVFVREEEDPFIVKPVGKGILNIIDLANTYSCSFIATEDLGVIHTEDSFEVLGRIDNSEIRGCSLLVI
jgi:phenylacetate-coenzyme A ligase PaaK-like adenylate-forming protein